MKAVRRAKKFATAPLTLLKEINGVERFYLGPKPFVFVADAEAAGKVLVSQATNFRQNRFVFDRIRPVTGRNGLVQLEGAKSGEARKQSRPVFAKTALEDARRITERRTCELIKEVGEAIDPSKVMTSLILGTAFEIFLGIQIDVEKAGADYLELNRICGRRMRSPFTFPSFRLSILRRRLREVILSAKETPLTRAFADDPHRLDHFMTFLFAGHETTAASIAFSLLLLGQRPDLQRRIYLGETALAREVYREALRLYPPAYMLARQAHQNTVLNHVQIKRGDTVIIAQYGMHHSSEYFSDPEAFLPGRRATVAYSYNPFGTGAKACLGERLAYLEAEVVIEAFCREFEWSGPEKIKSEALITLHPQANQYLKLERRTRDDSNSDA